MFIVYIDDSGTAPDQAVAIASALIIPAKRIASLDKEWATFAEKEGFNEFHSSECVARNPKSVFAAWDGERVLRVTSRVRQVAKKYGVKAFSFATNKVDYDEVVPEELKVVGGRFHYTWAIRNVISCLDRWCQITDMKVPLEYVFDWMDNRSQREAKREIETVMAQAESIDPGRYTHSSFRKRQDIPALQCTDMLAWTCYQFALHAFKGVELGTIAAQSFWDFDSHRNEWLTAITYKRKQLSD